MEVTGAIGGSGGSETTLYFMLTTVALSLGSP